MWVSLRKATEGGSSEKVVLCGVAVYWTVLPFMQLNVSHQINKYNVSIFRSSPLLKEKRIGGEESGFSFDFGIGQ